MESAEKTRSSPGKVLLEGVREIEREGGREMGRSVPAIGV